MEQWNQKGLALGSRGSMQAGLLPYYFLQQLGSSPGYSHCCFTAHSDLDPVLTEKITQAFVAIDSRDPAGKAVLEGEGCKAFVPGITTGWETLEKAAEQAGIL